MEVLMKVQITLADYFRKRGFGEGAYAALAAGYALRSLAIQCLESALQSKGLPYRVCELDTGSHNPCRIEIRQESGEPVADPLANTELAEAIRQAEDSFEQAVAEMPQPLET